MGTKVWWDLMFFCLQKDGKQWYYATKLSCIALVIFFLVKHQRLTSLRCHWQHTFSLLQTTILSYLDLKSLLAVSQTCTEMHELSQEPAIWRRLYLKRFGSMYLLYLLLLLSNWHIQFEYCAIVSIRPDFFYSMFLGPTDIIFRDLK